MPGFGLWGYTALNAYWFALSYLWNGLGPIILPVLVANLVGQEFKGTYLGLLTSVGLILAIIIQPVSGAISDRATFRWGRRRPFILSGTLFDLIFLIGMALSGSYWVLFLCYFLLQFTSNVAHGPYQGLIPDLVPEEKRGAASGAKQLLEILGIIVCSKAISAMFDPYSRSGDPWWLWLTFGSIMAILILTMLITIFGIKEAPLTKTPEKSVRETVLGTFNVDLNHYPDFAWLLVSRLFILTGVNLVRNYAQWFLADVVKVPNPVAVTGDLLAVIAIAIMLVVYPAGAISDKLGKKNLVAFSGLLGALGSFLLLFAQGRAVFTAFGIEVTDILAYGGIIGLSIGIFLSVNWALAIDLIPPGEGGRYLGISNLATAGAGVVAGLGGPLRDLLNARGPGSGYTALFLAAGLCYLVGTALLVKVREKRRA